MTTLTQPEMAAHDETTWKLYTNCVNARGRLLQAEGFLARVEAGQGGYFARQMDTARSEVEKAERTEKAAKVALDAHEESYTGWARFWCVPNGHIHSSRRCSTCYVTTKFYLAHEVSGMDEAAAVAAQGPALCTVCFPSAPVAWTAGDLGAAKRDAAKAEKAAKAAAAEAASVVVEGYRDMGRPARKVFKTERAATNAIASDLSSLTWYGTGHPMAEGWVNNVRIIREALAAKGVSYDYDKALTNARKRTVREGGQSKY